MVDSLPARVDSLPASGRLVFDYSRLASRISEQCKTLAAFSSKMKLSEKVISARLSGATPWRLSEIDRAAEILNIRPSELHLYFFTLAA